ncbi:uncharacterized protein J3D65DRAFT_685419 [Phyllosticta citribraziliensis]|uniref:Uncharacterized protein n=1 Tax=Phyllosticta citribraziliensis TaxID=989973 RepID=A0ABR1LE37_9PEZI
MTTDAGAGGDNAMSAPDPSGLQLPIQAAIFLRAPREVRDMIYDHVIDDEYTACGYWSLPDGRMRECDISYLGLHHEEYQPRPGPTERLPALATTCTQIRVELLETLYRTTRFSLEASMDHCFDDTCTQLELRVGRPFIDIGQVCHLDMELGVCGVASLRHIAQAKPFLKDPFSIRYRQPHGKLSDAALIRSDDSLLVVLCNNTKQSPVASSQL